MASTQNPPPPSGHEIFSEINEIRDHAAIPGDVKSSLKIPVRSQHCTFESLRLLALASNQSYDWSSDILLCDNYKFSARAKVAPIKRREARATNCKPKRRRLNSMTNSAAPLKMKRTTKKKYSARAAPYIRATVPIKAYVPTAMRGPASGIDQGVTSPATLPWFAPAPLNYNTTSEFSGGTGVRSPGHADAQVMGQKDSEPGTSPSSPWTASLFVIDADRSRATSSASMSPRPYATDDWHQLTSPMSSYPTTPSSNSSFLTVGHGPSNGDDGWVDLLFSTDLEAEVQVDLPDYSIPGELIAYFDNLSSEIPQND